MAHNTKPSPHGEPDDDFAGASVAWHASAMKALQVAGMPQGGVALRLQASAHNPVVAQMAGAMFVSANDMQSAAEAYAAAGLITDATFVSSLATASTQVQGPLQVHDQK